MVLEVCGEIPTPKMFPGGCGVEWGWSGVGWGGVEWGVVVWGGVGRGKLPMLKRHGVNVVW